MVINLPAWLLGALVALAVPAFAADDLIESRGLLEDPGGRLAIGDVVASDFEPGGRLLAKGYTDAALWLRLKLRAPGGDGGVVLRIEPMQLDDLRLYGQGPDGWSERVGGDRHPFAQRESSDVAATFLVHPDPREGSVYYLRLHTTSTAVLRVMGLASRDAGEAAGRAHLLSGLYLGVMGGIVLWVALQHGLMPPLLWRRFLAWQGNSFAMSFCLMGFASKYLFPELPLLADALTSLLICAQTVLAFRFNQALLDRFGAPSWLARVGRGLIPAFIAMAAAILSGHPRPVLQLNLMLAPVLALLLTVAAFRLGPLPRRIRRLLIGSYTLVPLLVVVTMLPLFGLALTDWFTLYGWTVRSAVAALLLALLLRYVAAQASQDLVAMQAEALASRRLAEWERRERETQGRFVDMLTHELRGPLSVIRMAISSLKGGLAGDPAESGARLAAIGRAVADVNAIVERCADANRIDQGGFAPQVARCSVATLLNTVLAGRADAGRVDLTVEPSAPDVETDTRLLGIAVGNLVDNALKYAPASARVRVDVAACSAAGAAATPGVGIEVSNALADGDFPDPQQIFQRYYRGPQAHAKTGTGLGLHLVHAIANLLGGAASYRPATGSVTFALWVPLRLP